MFRILFVGLGVLLDDDDDDGGGDEGFALSPGCLYSSCLLSRNATGSRLALTAALSCCSLLLPSHCNTVQ